MQKFARLGRFTPTLTIAAIVAIAALSLLRITGGPAVMSDVADATHMCLALSIIAAALLLLARWRFLDEDGSAWLACALLVLGFYLHPALMLGEVVHSDTLRMAPTDLAVMLLLMWAMRSAGTGRPPTGWRHPVLLGVGAGLGLAEARSLIQARFGAEMPVWFLVVLIVCFVIASLICIRSVVRLQGLPTVYRWHLAVPLSVAIGYHHFLAGSGSAIAFPHLLCALISTLAAFEVMATSLALVQDAHQTQRGQLVELADRAARAEVTVEHDQELLHEARATVAGISSASQLIATASDRLPKLELAELQMMLEAEMRRLQQLLEWSRHDAATGWIDVDELLHPLVVAHRAQGGTVEHRPSGMMFWGDRESVTTAVHVLLCNAQRHAPGAHVTIWTTTLGDTIALHVGDDGPGLDPAVTARLFTRGGRSVDSVGEGLGLYSARRSLQDHGADLLVIPSERGALFALTLPQVAQCSA